VARIDSQEAEHEALLMTAKVMAAAVRTAPKTRGLDSVRTLIVDGDELPALAAAMEAKVDEKAHKLPFFGRDARNVAGAGAVLLIGVTGEPKKAHDPINCGACGYGSCAAFLQAEHNEGEDFAGPLCVFQSIDLGVALGAAAKIASEFNVDNRIMYTLGAAARKLRMLDGDVVIGIPLSVSSKNPYFDR
jgi:uncharacterized ferredoxin-like protein